ncbi:MAG: hypothetical protein V3W08_08530, partial [Candidatus Binatia bacterium]
ADELLTSGHFVPQKDAPANPTFLPWVFFIEHRLQQRGVSTIQLNHLLVRFKIQMINQRTKGAIYDVRKAL